MAGETQVSGTDDVYQGAARARARVVFEGFEDDPERERKIQQWIRVVSQRPDHIATVDEARRNLQQQLDEARDELERLRTGETCQVGQPASCGDFHTAGQCVRTISATERQAVDTAQRLRGVLRDVLAAFHEKGHPGYPALRSAWINVEQIKQWQEEINRG